MDNKVIIPIHSLVDLITNSSTEIFVHSEDSVEPAKEILAELLKMNGVQEKVEDLFDIKIEYDESDIKSVLENGEINEEDYKKIFGDDVKFTSWGVDVTEEQMEKPVKEIMEKINNGEKLPEWFNDNIYHIETFLVIKSKDSKYDKFIDLLIKFLYSPDWFEHQWG